jgi:hypothetical protein
MDDIARADSGGAFQHDMREQAAIRPENDTWANATERTDLDRIGELSR